MVQNNRHYPRAGALKQTSAKPPQTNRSGVAADLALPKAQQEQRDLRVREKLLTSPYLTAENGVLKVIKPASSAPASDSTVTPLATPFTGNQKDTGSSFKASADFAAFPSAHEQSAAQSVQKLLNSPYLTAENGVLKVINPAAASSSAGFADPGLLAAQQAQEMIKTAPYLHLMGQKDNSQPAKVQLTKEAELDPYSSVFGSPTETQKPIDWIARWDDLNRAIEYLTLNGTHEDANGNIPNYAPQLQTLITIRDQIRNSIKPLVDMDVEGYNGNWDPAFDPLVNSLVKESKQGEKILDGLQLALDVAGFVPGPGEAADGLNALISLLRGNYVDAGLSTVAITPIAGWGATLGKLAKKAIKGADTFETAAKYSDEVVEAGESVTKELEDQIDNNWYHPEEPGIIDDAPKVAEGTGKIYTQGSKIPEEITNTKPSYSPVVNKWLDSGGKITIENGTWKYTNPQGISVTYKNGYPDFNGSGLVIQEVDIGPFRDRAADFKLADQLAPNGTKNPSNTWHHHEDGRTLQEVNRRTHEMFTHKGGISINKRGGK